jgi:mitochondrial fission protein ELM1
VIRNRLQSDLNGDDKLFVWDGSGANPFDAMLHHATAIVTTPDSISMTTEAIATGKAVFTVCADRISVSISQLAPWQCCCPFLTDPSTASQGKFHSFHETLFRENFTTALSLRSAPLINEPSSHGREAIEKELEAIAASLAQEILRQS